VSALLTHLAPWHWLLAAIVLMIAETLLPGSFLLWFGVGAAVTAGLLWLLGLSWQAQWICFALVSIGSIVAWRRFREQHPEQTSHPTLNQRGQSYVGRRYTLGEAIVDGQGKLHVDDTAWKVSGEDMPAGAHVRVTGVEGTVLKVERVDAG
jgi:hypothetical protein